MRFAGVLDGWVSQIHVEMSVVKLCRDVSDCVMHAWHRAHMQIVATHDVLVVSDMCGGLGLGFTTRTHKIYIYEKILQVAKLLTMLNFFVR